MKKKMYILCGLLIEKYRTAMKTTSRKEKRSTAAISVSLPESEMTIGRALRYMIVYPGQAIRIYDLARFHMLTSKTVFHPFKIEK